MDDNGQIVAVGFILVIALGAALAFGGLIDLPSFSSNSNPIEVLGIEFQEPLFSPYPVELNLGFSEPAPEEMSLEKHIFVTTAAQSLEQTQTQSVLQAHDHGSCQLR